MRFAKAIATLLLALIVVWVLGATWVRLRAPDATQAAALAALAVKLPPLASDRNVADDARLQARGVPPNRRDAALAAVRRQDERHEALFLQGKYTNAHIAEDPLPDYPGLPDVGESPSLCKRSGPDCLAKVRADPAATAALLETHAQRLDDALALADNAATASIARPRP